MRPSARRARAALTRALSSAATRALSSAVTRRLSSAPPPPAPAVGVAAAIFARLPCGAVDLTKMALIRRGTPPGRGLLVFAGGRQEHGETLAAAAAREAREETGLHVHVADALCPGYAATDVLHPAAPPHAYHYAIVHVLTCVDARADASGVRAELPALTAGDDASAALWVDLTALLLQLGGAHGQQPAARGRARDDGGDAPRGGGAGAPLPPRLRDALPPPEGWGGAGGGGASGGGAGGSGGGDGGAGAGMGGGRGDAPAAAPAALLDAQPPCLLALDVAGALVPLTVAVARRAVRQWRTLGVPTVGGDQGAFQGAF